MKTMVRKATKDESGKILILVLVLLGLGALLLAPLLGLMGTGLIAGEVYERKAAELYAADAGVEDAIWRIQDHLYEEPNNFYPYSYPEPAELWIVNGKRVHVVIDRYGPTEGKTVCHIEHRYRILSTATGSDGSPTTIDAVVTSVSLNFTDLTGNAITSGGGVTILGEKGTIEGDILLSPDGELKPFDYEHEGGEIKRRQLVWPEPEDFALFYWQDVKYGEKHYGDRTIDLNGANLQLPGSLYVDGTLTITDSKKSIHSTLTLGGTIYATGEIFIDNADITVDLNSHTIFTESATKHPEGYAFYVKTSEGNPAVLTGPGVIAAIGDIHFEPRIDSGEDAPILIISVEGQTELWPKGTFYGSVIGRASVGLQPNNTLIYPTGGFGGINFPGLIGGKETYTVDSWNISPQ